MYLHIKILLVLQNTLTRYLIIFMISKDILRVIIYKDQTGGSSGVPKNVHIPIFYS